MNIKKDTLKTMCAVLACSTFLSSLLPAYATTIISESPMDESVGDGSDWTADEGSLEEIEVTYKQASSYNVIIPKTITLGQSKQATYSVKVTGDIDANERVHVVPVDGISGTEGIDFYMKDQTPDSKKANVVATVTQSKFYWNSEEVVNGHEETNNSINAPDLTAGTWKGTFQVAINLETKAEHVHNYVDGKCDCGEIDPNHEHNYKDGTCTICGEKIDTYEVAPANAYSNWNYTLDTENEVITLNYYIGSETDVTVYARYEIDGITYKTQLNDNSSNSYKYYMFAQKTGIKTVKFNEGIDTSNVTSMHAMFYDSYDLQSIDLSGLDTSNVTDMSSMFRIENSHTYNTQLTTIIFGDNFNTSNVTTMNQMFNQCKKLTNLDVSNFDTSNVTDMEFMFYNCMGLTNLDVSNWNTSNVTNMNAMFCWCYYIESLDLSNWDTSKVIYMGSMFNYCANLTTIYATEGKWSTSQATTTDMFSNCGTSSVTYK